MTTWRFPISYRIGGRLVTTETSIKTTKKIEPSRSIRADAALAMAKAVQHSTHGAIRNTRVNTPPNLGVYKRSLFARRKLLKYPAP